MDVQGRGCQQAKGRTDFRMKTARLTKVVCSFLSGYLHITYRANQSSCRLPPHFPYIDYCEPVRNVQDIVLDFSKSHVLMLHYMVCNLSEIYDKHYNVVYLATTLAYHCTS